MTVYRSPCVSLPPPRPVAHPRPGSGWNRLRHRLPEGGRRSRGCPRGGHGRQARQAAPQRIVPRGGKASGGRFHHPPGGRAHPVDAQRGLQHQPHAPDLKVTFGRDADPLADSKPPAYPLQEGTYTVIAPLRAASGAQTYELPAGFDLADYGSLIIWCEQFNATMAWSPLAQ
ncbi:DM13 domain-containing protein [Cyanobium sp. LEGE 06113]|nr:DM13 domain-containing protein [Cyanobium sp. LEGE 06113]